MSTVAKVIFTIWPAGNKAPIPLTTPISRERPIKAADVHAVVALRFREVSLQLNRITQVRKVRKGPEAGSLCGSDRDSDPFAQELRNCRWVAIAAAWAVTPYQVELRVERGKRSFTEEQFLLTQLKVDLVNSH